jgi:putative redox protein
MADAEKPKTMDVVLVWEHDLVFGGHAAQARLTLDSAGAAGPSPMQALAFALAGCMAMDVVHVLRKGRHDLRGLRLDLAGVRQPDPPRRFTAFELVFTVTGAVAAEHVERAIELSRAKYCSVWHTLREDIRLDTRFHISEGV